MCSLFTLAEMFELPPAVVHSTISKMIINEELQVCKQYSYSPSWYHKLCPHYELGNGLRPRSLSVMMRCLYEGKSLTIIKIPASDWVSPTMI